MEKLTTKQKEFLKEFYDLLHKYDAEIFWTCDECSDLYGLCNDHLEIEILGQKNLELIGTNINKYNIKEEFLDNGNEGENGKI